MAEIKGKILKIDEEKRTVLLSTGVSDTKNWGVNVEEKAFVLIDFSTCSMKQILTWATGDRRIAVRRAHLIPMGAEAVGKTSKIKPYKVSAEDCSKEQEDPNKVIDKAMRKMEDASPEQLQEMIRKLQELASK